ncbi:MAG: SCO6745 family protein [Ilumatobacteraceae bacterium]
MNDQGWIELGRRASFVSHRLIGWIYWDPRAIEMNAALGIPNGLGYYVTSRAAPLLSAGADVVSAVFYSINPVAIRFAVDLAAEHTDWRAIYDARNAAVGEGLREFVPEICDGLAELGPRFWDAADSLPESGRALFAAHRSAPRVDDPLVSAWLGVNCLREWRGDTHFAILLADGIDRVQAGILHDAHLNYGGWIPRSRGADDEALRVAFSGLERRGLAENGVVNDAGLALRARLEERTDEICAQMWNAVGEDATRHFVELVEPVGQRLLTRIDETAGPDWMPAARERRS